MTFIETLVLVLHVLVALAICGLVLLQHGKGADMGAAFGSGSSGSLFGASGSANFLSRSTAVLAAVFFVSSLALTWFGATVHGPARTPAEKSIMDTAPAGKASDVPAPSSVLPPPSVPPSAPSGTAPVTPKSGEVPK